MTEAIPSEIKANPLLKHIWKSVHFEEGSFCTLVIGRTGSGKSTAALKLCEILDPSFDASRIVFNTTDLFSLVNSGKIGRGNCILYDESVAGSDSSDARNSLSKSNKVLSYFMTAGRQFGFIVFYLAPNLAQFDSRLRSGVGIHAILRMDGVNRLEKTSRGVFYLCRPASMYGKMLVPMPRIWDNEVGAYVKVPYIDFDLPKNGQLLKDYKELKTNFLKVSTKEWEQELRESRQKKKGSQKIDLNVLVEKASKDLFVLKDKNDKFSTAKIRSQLKVGLDTARAVKTLLIAKSKQF